jgi:hypothetical protein
MMAFFSAIPREAAGPVSDRVTPIVISAPATEAIMSEPIKLLATIIRFIVFLLY